MVADGITKALSKAKFSEFMKKLGMEDIKEWLNCIKYMEDLKEKILEARTDHQSGKEYVGWGGNGFNTTIAAAGKKN